MINNIYTFYKYDTTSFTYVGKSTTATNKTGVPGFTTDKPKVVAKGNIAVYSGGVGPWVEESNPIYTIAVEKTLAVTLVKSTTERLRAKRISPHPMQNLVYLEKYAQAKAYKAAGYPSDVTPYPFIVGDIVALSKLATTAADDIIAEYDATLAYSVLLEQYRLQTQVAVSLAEDVSGIESAMSNFNQLLDAI